MTATVKLEGMDVLQSKVKDWPTEVAEAVHQQIMKEVQPLLAHMKGRAFAIGGSARPVARTARLVSTQDGMSVVVGGSGLARLLTSGAEYGGRKRPKRAYVTRSRKGRGYIVRRRTTQQFKPHLGSRGYWFWPTARKDLKGINKRVAAVLAKVVND